MVSDLVLTSSPCICTDTGIYISASNPIFNVSYVLQFMSESLPFERSAPQKTNLHRVNLELKECLTTLGTKGDEG